MPTLRPSVQLYTLRDDVAKDFSGTLRKVAEIGYEGVELAGFGSAGSALAAKRAADEAGLVVSGMHVGLEALETDLDAALADAETVGTKLLICPYLADTRRVGGADYVQMAEFFDRLGAACADIGLTFCYHNHDFEFQTFPAKPGDPYEGEMDGMDLLFRFSDPKLVKSELDVYWVKRGGHDPAYYLKRMADRVAVVHLKDLADGSEHKFAPVGEGVLDFPAIVAAAVEAGVEWGVVEQDNCYDVPPIEAVRTSFENLKRMNLIT